MFLNRRRGEVLTVGCRAADGFRSLRCRAVPLRCAASGRGTGAGRGARMGPRAGVVEGGARPGGAARRPGPG